MKVFGICASPRNNATEHVLKTALNKLEDNGFDCEMFTCQAKSVVV